MNDAKYLGLNVHEPTILVTMLDSTGHMNRRRTFSDFTSGIILPMRILVCFLICTIGCRAQSPEDQVLAVYRKFEKAVQSGDANNTFIAVDARAHCSGNGAAGARRFSK